MKQYLSLAFVALSVTIFNGTAQGGDPRPELPVEARTECFVLPSPGTKIEFRYDCGYVVVPENRATAGGRTVKLGFIRLRARTETREPPLFMLSGGPGGSLIVPALFNLFQPDFLGPILDRRDVVVLDQRGTRHTVPHLNCPEFHALSWRRYHEQLGAEAGIALERRVLEQCVENFRRQGIDLAQYNSVALAADVNDARQALGYDQIFYYGASYGSQLGQHVMRDFPAMLKGVVLDGTSALSRTSWVEDRAVDVEFSLRQLDTLCREDEKCHATFDVPALIKKGLSLFDTGPIKASFVDPKAPDKTYPIEVGPGDFVNMVYEKLGYKIGVFSLPWFLELLVKDGRESMGQGLAQWRGEKLLAVRDAPGGELATIMYMAVVCSDDPVRSAAEVIREGAGKLPLLFADNVAQELIRMCEAINVPSLPDATDINVKSEVPTLILSGRLDAQTPTFRSEEVAKTLRNAQVVVFPDGTHVQVGAVNTCAMKIITQFLNNPEEDVPTDCLRDHRLPGFVLPDGTISKR